ncbi:MAG: divergent polysaccharide deacetylase family protein [Candidatus Omnitrophica bacterium]|nr:divergent polysaccharide deacetylase family protein [Candidatus Omnitrophota bacterium]
MKYNLTNHTPKRPFINFKLIIALLFAVCLIVYFIIHPFSYRSIVDRCDLLYSFIEGRIVERSGVLTAIKKSSEIVIKYGVKYKQWEIALHLLPDVNLEKFWRGIEQNIPEEYDVRKKKLINDDHEMLDVTVYYKGFAVCLLTLAHDHTAKNTGKIVFVVDDVGYNKNHEDLLFSLPAQVVVSILPQLPFSRHFSREADRRGYDVMLHLPLEAEKDFLDPGPGAIRVSMIPEEIRRIIRENIATVPNAIGVNNHMGSKVTADDEAMEIIVSFFKERNFFFLDSITSQHTVVQQVADRVDVPYIKRNVFLDNNNDPQYIKQQIKQLIAYAKQHSFAIGIGHYRRNTLRVLLEVIPQLEEEGVELVRIGEVLKRSNEAKAYGT